MFGLRDASTDPVTPRDASTIADDLSWRDHVARARDDVAHAAAEDVGRAGDEETISQARRVVETWLTCCKWALGILVLSGALFGLLETSVLLRPADRQIHAEWTLMVIVATPLSALAVRCVLRLWGGSLLLDWFVPGLQWLREMVRRPRYRPAFASPPQDATTPDLTRKTTERLKDVLVDKGSVRPLSAAGSGVFWTAYAVAALVTILIVTNVTAFGFGFGWTWESSWFWLGPRHVVVELARGMVEFPALVLGCIGSDGLTPVAPAPIAPDHPETLAVRRSWVCALTAGVGVYVLLPMALWTVCSFMSAKRQMNGGQPNIVSATLSSTHARRRRKVPTEAPLPPLAGGGPCTHVVRLERPGTAVALPAPLDGLHDLGNVNSDADLKRVLERVRGNGHVGPVRFAVVVWLQVTADNGVKRKLQTLVGVSTEPPLLVLDGGHALRAAEWKSRLDDWCKAASETGVETFVCDLKELTEASRRDLARAVGSGDDHDVGRDPPTASGSKPTRR